MYPLRRPKPSSILYPSHWLVFVALLLAIIAWYEGSISFLKTAVFFSAAICFYFVVTDILAVLRGEGLIGRLILLGGTFYWFWLDAIELARSVPPFPAREVLYPFFSKVVPADITGRGIVCINLFTLAILLGWRYVPVPRRVLSWLADRRDIRSRSILDLANLVLSLLGWVPLLISFDWNLSRAFDALLLMRTGGASGAVLSTGIYQHLQLLGTFGAALALARLMINVPGPRWPRILAIVIALPLIILSSTRFVWGYMALPALLMLVAPARHSSMPWRRSRSLAIILASFVFLMTMLQGATRTIGFKQYFMGQDEAEISLIESGFYGHEHFSAMLMAIDLVDQNGEFFMEPMLPFFITHFIPRALWPDKTYSETWQYYNAIITQGHAFNVTPSVTGQYYMNWGFFGVFFVGGLFGWYAKIAEAWFTRLDFQQQMFSATVCGLFLSFIFLSFRMLYPLYFAYPLFGFLAYWFLSSPLPRQAMVQSQVGMPWVQRR